jgi:hypothetical protein
VSVMVQGGVLLAHGFLGAQFDAMCDLAPVERRPV